jgi:tetratricopeptide (TPR) repeat protein
LWDIGVRLGSGYLMWAIATLSLHVRADAKPVEQSPWLYRIARTAHGAEVETLLERAEDQVDTALRAFPLSFRVVCERTHELRLSVDSPAVRKGRSRALAVFSQQARVRREAIDRALADLDRARRLDPNDPEIARARVRVLALWEEPGSLEGCEVRQRTAAAIDALRELQALRPEEVSSASVFELGSLLARQADYAGAAAEYRRAISLALDDADRSAAYAQLAQVTMLSGDAAGAVPYYRSALASAGPSRATALLHFGLGVALDRTGEHAAAIEEAVKAMELAERSLDVLAPDNVEFEPANERYVYEALAHEALAQLQPEERTSALEAAAESYAAFLTRVDANHLYRNAAESDLRSIVAQLGAARPRDR